MRRAKWWLFAAVTANAGIVLLFVVHLWPQLQVLISSLSSEELDYMIPSDSEPDECLHDDTPVESHGEYILQKEAEVEWLAEEVFHSIAAWKGPRHKEIWTPGPFWAGALVVLAMLLNGAVPYAIRSSATAMIRPDLDQAGAFCLVGKAYFVGIQHATVAHAAMNHGCSAAVAAAAAASDALRTCGRISKAFAYAGRGISPLKDDVEVLGVLRGRLVVGYHMSLEAVNVFANGTKLKPLKGNNWRKQECRYGERDCKYAEFAIPPLPADINVLGRLVGGQVLINVSHFLPEDSAPSAALWNQDFMRKKPVAPQKRLQAGRKMIGGLRDGGWS
ncbi:unnamed protein product [Symbiodinium pilosum]|uniref:Uncharacterized protein n=1 Tax=Symbiodinium pilosum TaxID=2952 RepID=A0A812JF83_SYMPI|nr:unnamed protein product [Symbiodinium pilosum]